MEKRKKTEAEKKHFKYGDLVVYCHECGSTQVLARGIENGLQMTLLTNPDSFIELACDKCPAKMKMFFVRGQKPKKVKAKKNENIQEENKEEQAV
jgi:hypothetical protein